MAKRRSVKLTEFLEKSLVVAAILNWLAVQQDESSASLVSVLWEAWDRLNKEMVKSWLFWWEMEIVGVNSFWVMLAAIDLVSWCAVSAQIDDSQKKKG